MLVSVFGRQEACEAVLGGALIIDSEDPRSALGTIKSRRIMDIADAVRAVRRELPVQLSTNIAEGQLLYRRAAGGLAIGRSPYEMVGKAAQAALGVAVSMGTAVHPCPCPRCTAPWWAFASTTGRARRAGRLRPGGARGRPARRRRTPPRCRPGRALTAGVNSFGATGTNVDRVLRSAPSRSKVKSKDGGALGSTPVLLPVSARSPPALTALAGHYADLLSGSDGPPLADVCVSAAGGRDHYRHRLVLTASTAPEAAAALRAWTAGETAEAGDVVQGVVVSVRRPPSSPESSSSIPARARSGRAWDGNSRLPAGVP
ncbi:ketoacyl-synthetase C-terminal extension domain-containing protein [Kitasatospora sp. NPDC058965]|uniref:CurL C-terminal domain-containing protein n=1 Tax=Kitasatospora sp. NPDC058965 TaxID=3346682 RepID=UPI0036B7E220